MPAFLVASILTKTGRGFLPIAVLVAFDAVIPMTPGEAAVILGGVLAEKGEQSVFLVFGAALAGALVEDNVAYRLGRHVGEPITRRIARGEEGRARLADAERQLVARPWIVAVARFVPGGRTAATVAAGIVAMPWPQFAVFQLAGAATWAVLFTGLGYLGGSIFQNSIWAFLVSLGFALTITAVAETVRRTQAASSSS